MSRLAFGTRRSETSSGTGARGNTGMTPPDKIAHGSKPPGNRQGADSRGSRRDCRRVSGEDGKNERTGCLRLPDGNRFFQNGVCRFACPAPSTFSTHCDIAATRPLTGAPVRLAGSGRPPNSQADYPGRVGATHSNPDGRSQRALSDCRPAEAVPVSGGARKARQTASRQQDEGHIVGDTFDHESRSDLAISVRRWSETAAGRCRRSRKAP